jgi:hypothetical protein
MSPVQRLHLAGDLLALIGPILDSVKADSGTVPDTLPVLHQVHERLAEAQEQLRRLRDVQAA